MDIISFKKKPRAENQGETKLIKGEKKKEEE